jgi:hypothetical protein
VFLAGCVAGTLLLMGCTGTGTNPDPAASPSSSVTATDGHESPRLEAQPPDVGAVDIVFQPTAFRDVRRYLDFVETVSLYGCLAGKGFKVDEAALQEPLVVEVGEPDLDQRRRVGYGLTVASTPPAVDGSSVGSDGTSVDRATFGGPSDTIEFNNDGLEGQARVGGCRGEVLTALYGDPRTYLELDSVQQTAHNRSTTLMPSSEQEPVRVRWSACMDGRGYSYDNQSRPKADMKAALAESGPTPEFADRERKVATDDGECTVEAGLPELRKRAATDYIATLSAGDLAQLNGVVDHINAALHRADAVYTAASSALAASH